MGAADAEVRPVRLVITTDCDAGFRLWAGTEPLANVPPGGEYVVECFTQEPVSIGEVVVRDFALVQVAVGNQVVRAKQVKRRARSRLYRLGEVIVSDVTLVQEHPTRPRLYRLSSALPARVNQCVAALLRNDGGVSLKPKTAALVRERASSSEEFAR